MSLYPITLGIAHESRGAQTDSEPEKLSAEIRQKVLTRDNHTCQFCHFKSQKYQEVHFIDRDTTNFHMDNMVTACIFCHQCFDLEKVAEWKRIQEFLRSEKQTIDKLNSNLIFTIPPTLKLSNDYPTIRDTLPDELFLPVFPVGLRV